jgi:hypothetical protein
MDAAAAVSSTVGVTPAATRSRAAATRAARVRAFCQAFYWDASEPVRSDDSRGIDAGPVDMSRVQASAAKNGGIEILGPPPFSQVTQD